MKPPSSESLAEAAKLYDDIAAIARTLDERDALRDSIEQLHGKALARIAALEDEMKIKDEIHRMDEIAYSEMEAELTAANARITALEAEVICQNKLKSRVMELEAEVSSLKELAQRYHDEAARDLEIRVKTVEVRKAQLRRYGDHVEKCPAHPANWETALPAGACIPDCGWAAIEEGLA